MLTVDSGTHATKEMDINLYTFVIVVSIVLQSVIDVESQRCMQNYDYNIVDGKCYRQSNDSLPWSRARVSCQRDGGDLAVLYNHYTVARLAALLDTDLEYWIGLQKLPISRIKGWTWLNKKPVLYDLWGIREPNDDTPEGRDCGHSFWKRNFRDMRWNDRSCTGELNYICEKVTENCPQGYTPKSGKCYKQSTDIKSWDDARKTCLKDGADLATVLNAADHRAIKGFVANIKYWIGLVEVPYNATKDWKWITGDYVNKDQWATNLTLWESVSSACGSSVYTGEWKWNITLCTVPKRYLCQMDSAPGDLRPVTVESMDYLKNMTSPKNKTEIQNNLCPCKCQTFDPNPSPTVLAQIISKIQNELKVETKTLSSKRNKKVTAHDDRPENRIIGYVSFGLVAIPVCLIIAIDIVGIFQKKK